MGRITSGVGLVSGINSKELIDQLMELESRPKTRLQSQIETTNERKLAFVDINTRLTSLRLISTTLKKPSTFENATARSNDENVISASTSPGAAVGSYQFQVARLVTSQQAISRGFANANTAKVGAGTISVELGGGEINSQTTLNDLRGGDGIRRGAFRITDRSGKSAVIDVTSAVTLDDVIKKINTTLDIAVKAQVSGDKLKLTDLSGGLGAFRVEDIEGSSAAEDLGLTTDSDGDPTTITGSDVRFVSRNTALANLNDGRGVRFAATGPDFSISTGGGQNFDVSLAGKNTLGEVIDAINTATGGVVVADIVPGSNGIRLTDTTASGTLTVTADPDSGAALDLGIAGTGNNGITGKPLIAGLNSVLIRSLNGGAGFTLGSVTIQDRAGTSSSIDLSTASSVQEILDAINNASVNVKASISAAGNSITLTDQTGGGGNLVITDGDGTNSATTLGLAGTFGLTTTTVKGANLQRQWVTENTLLKDYNGGRGIPPGKFRITDSTGAVATIDLTQGDEVRLADVIREINEKTLGVTASINATGDGLLLTDTAGGGARMKVIDLEGTTAKDLNVLGEATTTTINGSFEKTITLDATDTLATVQSKITALNWGVAAQIINDGTAAAPFRLSLSARNPGLNGRFVFDAGATTLDTGTLVQAQNAAVFLGSADAAQPLMITASSNNLSGVIRGVSIELQGVSDRPVTLNITRTSDNVKEQLTGFTTKFNELVDKFDELTKFDPTTFERGLLLGDATQSTIENEIYSMVNTVVSSAGRYRVLADVGLKIVQGAKLEFDEDKFAEAYNTDPDAVKALFTEFEEGVGFKIEARISRLIDPVDGVITRQSRTLDQKTTEFQTRITNLDKLIEQKRARLERQFAQLESVLSGLQSQQTAIGQIQNITPQR